MDLAEKCRVAGDQERQISQMSEEWHARRAVFLEKAPDHTRKYIDRLRTRLAPISIFRGYVERCHIKSSSDLSSSRKYAVRMKTLRQPISANAASVDRLRRLATVSAFSSTNPSEMPKSLAFEFYLMNLFLEQTMNQVNKKLSARTINRFQLEKANCVNARLDRHAESPL